jgi:TolB-like protein/tetratricopeptide (TPR) repeat protein
VIKVSVLALSLIVVGFFIYYIRHKETSTPKIKAIAVLPFKPLAGAVRDESLELGMADTLIARLGNITEITVRPISAVRRYTLLEQDPLVAGREQQVDAVLDGSIQKSADQIRVTVRLLRVVDGVQLWTAKFDEKAGDIFAIQDSISEQIAATLSVGVSGQERELLSRHSTSDPEAYQFYLRGRYLLNKSTQADFQKSVELFQAAVQKDPNYALAYTGLADAHAQLANFDLVQMNESYPKARQALTRALEIDEKLGEAHASLGFILMNYYWDWTEAEKQLSRAITLNPNYAMAHNWYAQYLAFMNRSDEAFRELRRAHEIDPLSPWINSGFVLFLARRYDDAISAASKSLELDPDFSISHMVIGLSYVQKRMFDDAIAELRKAKGNPDSRPLLAYAYALAGQKSEARKIVDELEQLSKSQYVSPFPLAIAYGAMGERDRAFEALEKAYAQRSWAMGMLKVNPVCDPLRSDPRFAVLLQRVDLAT